MQGFFYGGVNSRVRMRRMVSQTETTSGTLIPIETLTGMGRPMVTSLPSFEQVADQLGQVVADDDAA